MMKINYKFTTLLLCSMLSGCFRQLPAAISYNDATTRMINENGQVEGEVAVKALKVPTNQPISIESTTPNTEQQPMGYLQDPATSLEEDDSNVSYYEVVEGDSLRSIAAQHGVTVEALAYANKFATGYAPQEMELLKIPGPNFKIPPKSSGSLDDELQSLGNIGPAQGEQSYNVMPEQINDKAPTQSGRFIAPIRGHIITKFGQATPNGKSNGINITAPKGTPIYTSASGKVVYSGFDAKFGNLVIVQLLDNKMFVAYAHMDNLIVKKGQDIMQAEVIGHVGATGEVQHPQLHFAIRKAKKPVDPLQFVTIN